MPLWLLWAISLIWLIQTILVIAALNQWSKPRYSPSSAGAILVLTWIPFTILWWSWVLFG